MRSKSCSTNKGRCVTYNKGKGEGIKFLRSLIGHEGIECIIWPMSRDLISGHGHLGFMGDMWKAHRLMCTLAHGPALSDDHEASHTCGRGHDACVNPNHLLWETSSENQQRRKEHGTAGNGKDGKGTRWRLTPENVSEIRGWGSLLSQQELAAIYGTSYQNIGVILRGETWKTGQRENGHAARLANLAAKHQ